MTDKDLPNSLNQLIEAAEAVLTNEEHAFSGGMRSYKKGSQTWQVYEDLRLAIAAMGDASTRKDEDRSKKNPDYSAQESPNTLIQKAFRAVERHEGITITAKGDDAAATWNSLCNAIERPSEIRVHSTDPDGADPDIVSDEMAQQITGAVWDYWFGVAKETDLAAGMALCLEKAKDRIAEALKWAYKKPYLKREVVAIEADPKVVDAIIERVHKMHCLGLNIRAALKYHGYHITKIEGGS